MGHNWMEWFAIAKNRKEYKELKEGRRNTKRLEAIARTGKELDRKHSFSVVFQFQIATVGQRPCTWYCLARGDFGICRQVDCSGRNVWPESNKALNTLKRSWKKFSSTSKYPIDTRASGWYLHPTRVQVSVTACQGQSWVHRCQASGITEQTCECYGACQSRVASSFLRANLTLIESNWHANLTWPNRTLICLT